MNRDIEIIPDPLAWQDEVDNAKAPINTRGSARFWKTVEARGIRVVYRNGAPDFSEIVFDLGDNIGLELRTEEGSPFIRYSFVEMGEETSTENSRTT